MIYLSFVIKRRTKVMFMLFFTLYPIFLCSLKISISLSGNSPKAFFTSDTVSQTFVLDRTENGFDLTIPFENFCNNIIGIEKVNENEMLSEFEQKIELLSNLQKKSTGFSNNRNSGYHCLKNSYTDIVKSHSYSCCLVRNFVKGGYLIDFCYFNGNGHELIAYIRDCSMRDFSYDLLDFTIKENFYPNKYHFRPKMYCRKRPSNKDLLNKIEMCLDLADIVGKIAILEDKNQMKNHMNYNQDLLEDAIRWVADSLMMLSKNFGASYFSFICQGIVYIYENDSLLLFRDITYTENIRNEIKSKTSTIIPEETNSEIRKHEKNTSSRGNVISRDDILDFNFTEMKRIHNMTVVARDNVFVSCKSPATNLEELGNFTNENKSLTGKCTKTEDFAEKGSTIGHKLDLENSGMENRETNKKPTTFCQNSADLRRKKTDNYKKEKYPYTGRQTDRKDTRSNSDASCSAFSEIHTVQNYKDVLNWARNGTVRLVDMKEKFEATFVCEICSKSFIVNIAPESDSFQCSVCVRLKVMNELYRINELAMYDIQRRDSKSVISEISECLKEIHKVFYNIDEYKKFSRLYWDISKLCKELDAYESLVKRKYIENCEVDYPLRNLILSIKERIFAYIKEGFLYNNEPGHLGESCEQEDSCIETTLLYEFKMMRLTEYFPSRFDGFSDSRGAVSVCSVNPITEAGKNMCIKNNKSCSESLNFWSEFNEVRSLLSFFQVTNSDLEPGKTFNQFLINDLQDLNLEIRAEKKQESRNLSKEEKTTSFCDYMLFLKYDLRNGQDRDHVNEIHHHELDVFDALALRYLHARSGKQNETDEALLTNFMMNVYRLQDSRETINTALNPATRNHELALVEIDTRAEVKIFINRPTDENLILDNNYLFRFLICQRNMFILRTSFDPYLAHIVVQDVQKNVSREFCIYYSREVSLITECKDLKNSSRYNLLAQKGIRRIIWNPVAIFEKFNYLVNKLSKENDIDEMNMVQFETDKLSKNFTNRELLTIVYNFLRNKASNCSSFSNDNEYECKQNESHS